MRWKHCLLLLLPFFSLAGFPERNARGETSENFLLLQSKIQVSLSQRTFKEGDRIPLLFQIQNTGKEVIRIFPSQDFRQTFQLVIKDKENRIVVPIEDPEFSDPILKRRSLVLNLSGDETKEIILHKGDSFAKTIYLDEFYAFNPNEEYQVKGYFFPNYQEDKTHFVKTLNSAAFFYEPRAKTATQRSLTSGQGESPGVSPEETIFLFLGSELKKNWESHFKWIDFSEYILGYDKFAEAYSEGSPTDRQLIVEEFKRYLTDSPSGNLKYYKVLSVDYLSPTDAKVQVYVERAVQRYASRYEYIYTLKKSETGNYWKIKNLLAKVRK